MHELFVGAHEFVENLMEKENGNWKSLLSSGILLWLTTEETAE